MCVVRVDPECFATLEIKFRQFLYQVPLRNFDEVWHCLRRVALSPLLRVQATTNNQAAKQPNQAAKQPNQAVKQPRNVNQAKQTTGNQETQAGNKARQTTGNQATQTTGNLDQATQTTGNQARQTTGN
jgi:hypothetical protein